MNKNVLLLKTYIPQEHIDVMNLLFKKLDKEGKGEIDIGHLVTFLRLVDLNPTNSDINEMIETLNNDPNNPKTTISKDEIYACVAKKKRDPDTIDQLIESFKILDKKNEGLLSEHVIRYLLCNVGDAFANEEVDNFMKECLAFTETINDVKYLKYKDFALFLKDMYKPPPVDDPKGKGGRGGATRKTGK